MQDNCKNCKFFSPMASMIEGYCLRMLILLKGDIELYFHPQVNLTTHCEHFVNEEKS